MMSSLPRPSRPSRRSVLGGVAGAGLAAAAGPMLAGCGGGSAASSSGPSKTDVQLPTYVPFEGPEADFPSTVEGAPAGYTSYPKDLVTTVDAPPLSEPITGMANTFDVLPTSHDDNAAWLAVEERLGAKLSLTIVPTTDYITKYQAAVASSSLPDITLYSAVDQPVQFLDAVAADLTEHLSGDAVKDFPNLAAIPTQAWAECTVDNKIFKLPITRGMTAGAGFFNQTLLEAAGISEVPANTDDFYDALVELTRPQDGTWGIANSSGHTYFTIIQQMFGVPNTWRLDGGTLTADVETDEYAAAMEFMAKLVAEEITMPGSDGLDTTATSNAFKSGKGAFIQDGLPGYKGYWTGMPGGKPVPWVAVGRDSDTAVSWLDNVTFGTSFINKDNDADRVREILGVANFLAAPFGSEEHKLLQYGVEGVDHEIDENGAPVLTSQGERDMTVPWGYFAAPSPAIFDLDEEYVRLYTEANTAQLEVALENPVTGLISPTADEKGSSLDSTLTDVRNDILSGRRDMTAWEPALEAWREGGGEDMRQEYLELL